MSNWTKPDLSSTEVAAIDEYKGRDVDNAVMFDAGSISSIPENAIRFNVASGLFQRRQSGAWVDKPISVAGGGTGSSSAAGARTNLGIGDVGTYNTLPISKGGTGKTNASDALGALGGKNASNLNTGTLDKDRLPAATSLNIGAVILSSDLDSNDATKAATPRAVKDVQTNANSRLLTTNALSELSNAANALAARENISAHDAANLTTGTLPNGRLRTATTDDTAGGDGNGIVYLVDTTTSTATAGYAATPNAVRKIADSNITAGDGLSGGGKFNDTDGISFTLATPSSLSGNTSNTVTTSGHTHAISSTKVRNSTSTSTLLEAAAMKEHVDSGDHDSDYVSKTGDDSVPYKVTFNSSTYQKHINIERGVYSFNISPTTGGGGILKFATTTGAGFEFEGGKIIGDGSGLIDLNAGSLLTGTVPNARLNDASATTAGITKLINSTDNNSQTAAATANSVKLIADSDITAGGGLTGGGAFNDVGGISFALATPSSISTTSSNNVTTTTPSHTHALDLSGRSVSAGSGLTGGGNLGSNRTITLGTPSNLSGSTENATTAGSHTHAIVSSDLANSDLTTVLANSKAVKTAKDAADTAQGAADAAQTSADDADNKATPKTLSGGTTNASDSLGHTHSISKSNSITSTSTTTLATSASANAARQYAQDIANGSSTQKIADGAFATETIGARVLKNDVIVDTGWLEVVPGDARRLSVTFVDGLWLYATCDFAQGSSGALGAYDSQLVNVGFWRENKNSCMVTNGNSVSLWAKVTFSYIPY